MAGYDPGYALCGRYVSFLSVTEMSSTAKSNNLPSHFYFDIAVDKTLCFVTWMLRDWGLCPISFLLSNVFVPKHGWQVKGGT